MTGPDYERRLAEIAEMWADADRRLAEIHDEHQRNLRRAMSVYAFIGLIGLLLVLFGK